MRTFGACELVGTEQADIYKWGECFVKCLPPLSDEGAVQKASSYAALSTYPALCSLHGMTADRHLVYEAPKSIFFSPGQPLEALPSLSERFQLARQVAAAATLLHQNGITHGGLNEVMIDNGRAVLVPPNFTTKMKPEEELSALFKLVVSLLTNNASDQKIEDKLAASDLPDDMKVIFREAKIESADTLYAQLSHIKVKTTDELRVAAIEQEVLRRWHASGLEKRGYKLVSVNGISRDEAPAAFKKVLGVVGTIQQRLKNPHFQPRADAPIKPGFVEEMQERHVPATFLPGVSAEGDAQVFASFHGLPSEAIHSVRMTGPANLQKNGNVYGPGVYMSNLEGAALHYASNPANTKGELDISFFFFGVPYRYASAYDIQTRNRQRVEDLKHGDERVSDIKVVRVAPGSYFHIATEPAHVMPLATLRLGVRIDIPEKIECDERERYLVSVEAINEKLDAGEVNAAFDLISTCLKEGHPSMPDFFEKAVKKDGCLRQVLPDSTCVLLAAKVFHLYRERYLSLTQLRTLSAVYEAGKFGFEKNYIEAMKYTKLAYWQCNSEVTKEKLDVCLKYVDLIVKADSVVFDNDADRQRSIEHREYGLKTLFEMLCQPACIQILKQDRDALTKMTATLVSVFERHIDSASAFSLNEAHQAILGEALKNELSYEFLQIQALINEKGRESGRNALLKFLRHGEMRGRPSDDSLKRLQGIIEAHFPYDELVIHKARKKFKYNRDFEEKMRQLLVTKKSESDMLAYQEIVTRISVIKESAAPTPEDIVWVRFQENHHHRDIQLECVFLMIKHAGAFNLTVEELSSFLKYDELVRSKDPELMMDIYNFYRQQAGEHDQKNAELYLKKACKCGSLAAARILMDLEQNEAVRKQYEIAAFSFGDPELSELYFSDERLNGLFEALKGGDCSPNLGDYWKSLECLKKANSDSYKPYLKKFKVLTRRFYTWLGNTTRPDFELKTLEDYIDNDSELNTALLKLLTQKDQKLIKYKAEFLYRLDMLIRSIYHGQISDISQEPGDGIKLLPNTLTALGHLWEFVEPHREYNHVTSRDPQLTNRCFSIRLQKTVQHMTTTLENFIKVKRLAPTASMLDDFGYNMSYRDFLSQLDTLSKAVLEAYANGDQGVLARSNRSEFSEYASKENATAEITRVRAAIRAKRVVAAPQQDDQGHEVAAGGGGEGAAAAGAAMVAAGVFAEVDLTSMPPMPARRDASGETPPPRKRAPGLQAGARLFVPNDEDVSMSDASGRPGRRRRSGEGPDQAPAGKKRP